MIGEFALRFVPGADQQDAMRRELTRQMMKQFDGRCRPLNSRESTRRALGQPAQIAA
jgi:hypothetical protein